jgi:hypothetical protein
MWEWVRDRSVEPRRSGSLWRGGLKSWRELERGKESREGGKRKEEGTIGEGEGRRESVRVDCGSGRRRREASVREQGRAVRGRRAQRKWSRQVGQEGEVERAEEVSVRRGEDKRRKKGEGKTRMKRTRRKRGGTGSADQKPEEPGTQRELTSNRARPTEK